MDRDTASPVEHLRKMAAHSKAIQGESQALLGEAQGAIRDVEAMLETHPWGVALTAMGVGYVLGGGLFTRLSARLLCLGTKTLFLPMLEEHLSKVFAAPHPDDA